MSIIGLIWLNFSSIISPRVALAQEETPLKSPETTEELKEFGRKFLEAIPKGIKAAWQAAVDIWRGMWNWLKNLWNSYILPWFKGIWQKIFSFLKEEFRKRKALLGKESKEETLEKEKPLEEKEVTEGKENLWKKFWERLKTLIK